MRPTATTCDTTRAALDCAPRAIRRCARRTLLALTGLAPVEIQAQNSAVKTPAAAGIAITRILKE